MPARRVLDSSEPDTPGSGGLSVPFVEQLAISGASICVAAAHRRQSTISVSDALAAQIDELQYTLGEGPRWEALKSGAVVSAPNIRTKDARRWPMLTAALAELKVGALFAFPLRMGAVTVGVADLYRSSASGRH